jgi:trk system potassium uptake protein
VHVVIMGCGRVGSTLAETLDARGDSVAVIDQESGAFRRLPASFTGRTVTGVGFDREVLVDAGIEQAQAFAAVSSGDNSNILAARVARETFGVENVVARIYDPKRAEVYQRLGIATVATVRWTADQMMRRLRPEGALSEWADASGEVRLVEVHVDPSWIGLPVAGIEHRVPARVALLTRLGEGMLPSSETVLQEGDLVHVLVRHDDLEAATRLLAGPPPAGED